MKKRFLPLLIAVFVLMTAVTAHAAVEFTLFHTVLTGDESLGVEEFKAISSADKNSYGRVGIAPGSVLSVVDDGTGDNYAYKLVGNADGSKQQMAVNLYCSNTATSPNDYNGGKVLATANYQKFVTRVFFSDTMGTVQLYGMNSAFNSNANSDTTGVYLTGGGAYYYDAASSKRVNFIPNGTMEAGKWYTVEAIFDVSTNQVINMMASVYDENGMILGTSPLAKVSSLKWYSGSKYMRTFLTAQNFSSDGFVLFDDIALYGMSELPLVTAPQAEYNEETATVSFIFNDVIDETIISASNVKVEAYNPAIDVAGKFVATVVGDTITVDVSTLPYNETFTLSVMGYAIDSVSTIEITTPADPFENAVVGASYVEEDDSVVAIVDIANTSAIDRDYMFVITSWNTKNECVAIRALTGFIAAGETDDVELPAVPFKNKGDTIRISLVNNWLDMTPIGDALEYTLGGE